MSTKAEPCRGLEMLDPKYTIPTSTHTGRTPSRIIQAHCPGCTSTTERIEDLERENWRMKQEDGVYDEGVGEGHRVTEKIVRDILDGVHTGRGGNTSFGILSNDLLDLLADRKDLTSMRTLAEELVAELEKCRSVFVAQHMDISALHPEAALAKAQKLGVVDGG